MYVDRKSRRVSRPPADKISYKRFGSANSFWFSSNPIRHHKSSFNFTSFTLQLRYVRSNFAEPTSTSPSPLQPRQIHFNFVKPLQLQLRYIHFNIGEFTSTSANSLHFRRIHFNFGKFTSTSAVPRVQIPIM